MKPSILIIPLILFTEVCFAQKVNILNLKKENYFSQKNYLIIKPINNSIKLNIDVSYNKPDWVDEEVFYELNLTFLSLDKKDIGKTFDVAKETAILKTSFKIVYFGGMIKAKETTGTVKIISFDSQSIATGLNIEIIGDNKEIYQYEGECTFTK